MHFLTQTLPHNIAIDRLFFSVKTLSFLVNRFLSHVRPNFINKFPPKFPLSDLLDLPIKKHTLCGYGALLKSF